MLRLCDVALHYKKRTIFMGRASDEAQGPPETSYMVMQDVNYELFADSVEAECSFGIRNADRALVEAAFEEVGLASYRERHPNTLSGGQKQRVGVAIRILSLYAVPVPASCILTRGKCLTMYLLQ